MSTRLYEVGVIIRADLSDEDIAAQIETIGEQITSRGGTVESIDRRGRQRLAYPINRQRDGYYAFFKAALPPDAPAELERLMQINENVLRYLVLREDE